MKAASAGREPHALRVVTARFAVLTIALSAATGLGLWLTQPVWSLSSFIVFAAMAAAGVLFMTTLARLAARPASSAQLGRTSTPTTGAPSATPRVSSMRPGSDDQVDYLMALRHEFRTPLNAVLGFSDVLLGGIDGDINESQREDLEIIRASGVRLRVLLDSALDLSRLATEDLKPNIESVDARHVVERAAKEALQLWAGKQQARVSVSDEPCLVATDEARLRRSIVVLADFLATDNRRAAIEFDLHNSEDRIVVSVAAVPSERLILDALPTPAEVLASEDPMKIRRWPVAVTSELIVRNGGSLYHGDDPARFVIRLPLEGAK